jgi:hypothetical protein
VSELLKNLYEKSKSAVNTVDRAVSETKRKFTDALVDATDLMPADMRKGQAYEQGQQDIKTITGNLFDIATPDATAAVGKLTKLGKLGKMMAKPDMVSNIVGAASKANTAYGKIIQKNAESKQAGYGKVIMKDNQPKQAGYGKVTVLNPEPKQTGFGKVTVVDNQPKPAGYGKIIFKPF